MNKGEVDHDQCNRQGMNANTLHLVLISSWNWVHSLIKYVTM